MSDAFLFAFGCGVSFIAAAGVYVALRERFLAGPKPHTVEQPVEAPPNSSRAA